MTIVYQFPQDLVDADATSFRPERRHLVSSNPWTARQRILGPLDERWVARVAFLPMSTDEWCRFEAFIDMIDGQAGFFTFHDPYLPYPRGKAAGGNPTNGGVTFTPFDDGTTFDDGTSFADGAGFATVFASAKAGAEFVRIGGLIASQATSLKANDRVSLVKPGQSYGYLHKVLTDTASDANGEALVKIRPRLRRDVAIGDIAQLNFASGVFALVDEEQGRVERAPPRTGTTAFELVEAFEVIELT